MNQDDSQNSPENPAEFSARPRVVDGGRGLVVTRIGKSFKQRPVVQVRQPVGQARRSRRAVRPQRRRQDHLLLYDLRPDPGRYRQHRAGRP